VSYVNVWLTVGEKHLMCNFILDLCSTVGLNNHLVMVA